METSAEGINFKIIKLKLPEVYSKYNLANDVGGGVGNVFVA